MKRLFERTLECALVCLFIVIIVCVSLQVFFRYLLNDPLIWSEEVARLSFLWMVFLGLGIAERDHSHIAVDFFVDRMPQCVQKPLRLAVEVFGIAVLLTVGFFAIEFISHQKAMRSVALDISQMYFTAAIPAGCLIYSVYKVVTFNRIRKTDTFAPEVGAAHGVE